ncbi:MAG: hypothetical protein RBS56_01900 [Candidatus Gracilibacteria bacterium]|jgi:magnesium-transporting ATPase (P-type)|nr:hypothetical protein [Candidatus Gracilibacteria bacterium]
MNPTINNLIILALISLPTPIILLKIWDKIFTDTKTKNLKTVCLGANKTLLKNFFQLKNIIFDNYSINIKSDQNKYEIINRKEQKESNEKFPLKENEIIKTIAATTIFSSFKKTGKIEEAIVNFFNKNSLSKSLLEREYREIDKVIEDENSKITSSIVKKTNTEEIFAFSKGNPYRIIEKCTRILINGKKEPISPGIRHKLKKQVSKLNKKGKKVIGYAIRPLPLKKLDKYTSEFTEKEMIFTGFIAVKKPLNRESEFFIKRLKEKGLRVLLLTQLKEKTAVALAKELHIINEKHFEAITGEYFNTMTDQKKEKILKEKDKDFVFCEISGKLKNEIFAKLREMDEKPTWIDKKNTLEKTLKSFEKNERILENHKKVQNLALNYRPALILISILALISNIPSPISIYGILLIDLIITFPLILIIREKRLIKTDEKTLLIKNSILKTLLLAIGLFWILKSTGFVINAEIEKTDFIILSASTLIFLFVVFTQILNIFYTFKKKSINIKYILLIIIYALTGIGLFKIPEISERFILSIPEIKEIVLILSLIGIYASLNYMTLKTNDRN